VNKGVSILGRGSLALDSGGKVKRRRVDGLNCLPERTKMEPLLIFVYPN
jgi:hypothetical protein